MERHEVRQLMANGKFEGKPINGVLEETNISWVILGGGYAFKIKKNIKLSFLDYSTLSLRKEYCEKELHLNRRFSPIYLSVQPIIFLNDHWTIGEGQGEIKDYAVCMKRMRSGKRMDVLLKKKEVNPNSISLLANQIARFHTTAETIEKVHDHEQAKGIFNDLNSVQEVITKEFGKGYAKVISDLIFFSNRFLETHSKRLKERAMDGFTRDVHGDLHSGNIFLYKNPIIFDCIEFEDAFRQIDILYEIAFLCMDLEFFGRNDFSELFLKTYNKILPCFTKAEDEAIFVYYKCLRANIRAKVFLLNSKTDPDPDKKTQELEKGKKYLDLAVSYMQNLQQDD
jgi:uncharacterized protein